MAHRPIAAALAEFRRLVEEPSAEVTDGQLLARFVAVREETAFAALVRRHGPMVLAVGRRLLGDGHAAEDVCQAAFLVLARKASGIRKQASVGAWLHGVAWRLARRVRDRRGRQERQIETADVADIRTADPGVTAAWHELLAILDEEVARLPDRLRLPLVLCYLEGQSHAEAAEQLRLPLGTLKTRVARARELLRERLVRRGLTLPAAALGTVLAVSEASAALPAALFHAIVKSAVPLGAASTVTVEVAALAKEALAMMATGYAKIAWAAALAVGFLTAGVGFWTQLPADEKPPATPSKPALASTPSLPPAPTDLYGDPLPAGAVARLGTVRMRQPGFVHYVAVLPDGKRCLAGGTRTYLWDLTTGKEIHHIDPDRTDQNGWAFHLTSDARTMVGFGSERNVVVWDVEEWRAVRKFPCQRSYSKTVVSPDDKTLAVYCDQEGRGDATDHVIRLYELGTGNEIRLLSGHTKRIHSALFSLDGKSLISGSDDQTIRVWDVATGNEVRGFDTKPHSAVELALSPNGDTLATLGALEKSTLNPSPGVASAGAWYPDSKVHLWDWRSGKEVGSLEPTGPRKPLYPGHEPYAVKSLQFSKDGKTLWTGVVDSTIREWDLATLRERPNRSINSAFSFGLALTPDGRQLVVGGYGCVSVWDLATCKPMLSSHGHNGDVSGLTFSPDGRILATFSQDLTIRLWDKATGAPLQTLEGHDWTVGKVNFIDGGRRLLSIGGDRSLRVWDVATGKQLRCEKDFVPFGVSTALSRDGRLLAYCGEDHVIRMIDLSNGQELRSWKNPSKDFGSLIAFSPRDQELYTWAYFARTLQAWDVHTGRLLHQFPEKEPEVRDSFIFPFALSPDGRWVTMDRGFRNSLMVVDWRKGRESRQLQDQPDAYDRFAFSPDGRTLACGERSGQGRLLLWETATGQVRRQFGPHPHGTVSSLTFSPDGRTLASGGMDTTALLWDVTGLGNASRHGALSDAELQSTWRQLTDGDAASAYRAMWTLTTVPQQVLPLLRQVLKPVPRIPDERLRPLVTNLDSETFAVREQAAKELSSLGAAAEPFLRREVQGKLTLECRRRIERLLDSLEQQPLPGMSLAECRAVELLEYIGTREVQRFLSELAEGLPEASLTQEANEALDRMSRR